mmetsp:Transcript_65878/g.208501  ORF Transcript_65878/g.208501 Transcript_65878/m.208501 type:complete len:269 (-) Transcript_65878:34-840(-)
MVAALRLCTATAGARYGRIPPSAPISSRASTASASVTTRSARTHNSPAPPREAAARLSICPFVGARLSPVRLGNGFLPRVFKNFLPRPASLATTRGHTDLTTTCTMGKKKEMVKGAADGWTLESTGMEAPGGRNHRPDLNVVLVTPEIPGNTGSVARSCAATAVGMHLIEPLGFEIDDTKLKRAGLDYWPYVVVKVHKSFEAFLEFFDGLEEEKRLVAFSARAEISYRRSGAFKKGDWLLFGAETTGLPKEGAPHSPTPSQPRVRVRV